MRIPGDHHGDIEGSPVSISPHGVPGESDRVGRVRGVGGVGRVSWNLRYVFSVRRQVSLVIQIWNREPRILILDGDTVGTPAVVRNLQLPPSLHLENLGSVRRDGGSDQPILHVSGDEIAQGCHFRFGQ